MKQYEAVIQTMERLGSVATLGQLNQEIFKIKDCNWGTKTPFASIREIKENLQLHIEHYLIVDDYFTWWTLGRSYLCRIIDMLHMGILTEALFGKEVVERIPVIVQGWTKTIKK
jgi:hypothetical protein